MKKLKTDYLILRDKHNDNVICYVFQEVILCR